MEGVLMKHKSGVYVRAKDPSGRWGSVLAEELTLESFQMFVLRKLVNLDVVVAVKDENMSALAYEYRTDKHIVEVGPEIKEDTGEKNANT
jgi:hypothetical protein